MNSKEDFKYKKDLTQEKLNEINESIKKYGIKNNTVVSTAPIPDGTSKLQMRVNSSVCGVTPEISSAMIEAAKRSVSDYYNGMGIKTIYYMKSLKQKEQQEITVVSEQKKQILKEKEEIIVDTKELKNLKNNDYGIVLL